jgi:NAD(P)-dependent dehydrogenase (short-subunit alcohol dehydrogenase family)
VVYPFAPNLLAGQTVLVTGGGSGLGRAIAESLARAGADLLLAARKTERLELAAKELREATGRRVETAFVNIRERNAVVALEARSRELFSKIDVLVNNAGGQFAQAARDFSPKGWNAVIDTNLNGTWNMTQVFGARMLEHGGGVITNIIAVVGRGFPGLAHTAAARAGVLELTRTLAYEWGPKVRLNCVAPGAVETDGFKNAYDPNIGRLFDGIPLARYGTREEVAHAVTFLSSPAASYVTGEVLFVAGGQQGYGKNQALFDEQLGRK